MENFAESLNLDFKYDGEEEFVLKDMVAKQGLADKFYIASAATSMEEIGNPVHRGTKAKLAQCGISTAGKYAVRMERNDYEKYDYIIGMDSENMRNMQRLFGGDKQGKVFKLLSFAGSERDISDPWYTGDFSRAYADIEKGCTALFDTLKNE